MEGKYIGTIAHADGGDVEAVYTVGIPPVGGAEKKNLLCCGEFGDKVGNRSV